jgi:hypothetical protein
MLHVKRVVSLGLWAKQTPSRNVRVRHSCATAISFTTVNIAVGITQEMNTESQPPQLGTETVVVETSVMDDEAARKRAREFDDALYAALDCRAQSDQARALVDAVVTVVTEHEHATGTRTNRRNKKVADLRIAVEGFIADLLKAQSVSTSHGYVYRPVRPANFTEGAVGYRVFKTLTEVMTAADLLETYKGWQSWSDAFGARAPYIKKATRFRATQRLLDLSASHGIQPKEFHLHFLLPLPENPLQLRATSPVNSAGRKISGRMMPYEHTDATRSAERRLKELNAFLDSCNLRHGVHRGYIRVFNNGDDSAFNWNMGGRLYSYGEGNYQQMSREERLRMCLNLEPVCEIDIRASYLTIFHAWFGEQLDPERDPYDIQGLGAEHRGLVKRWVTASFGNNAPITKWPKDIRKSYLEETGKTISKKHSAAKIGAKVLATYPLLARLGETVNGHKCGWAELMYIESRAMFATMVELMERKVPSLAVHDSIIVPINKHFLASQALRHFYKGLAKAEPVLVSHAPKGHKLLIPDGVSTVFNRIVSPIK